MTQPNTQRKLDYAEFAFGAVAVISFFILLIRCRYGFANLDESFYLTVPYRLCQGDALFADEWHLSQMAGILLFPIMKVYLAIAQGTEGISLAFRYIYTVLHAAAAVFLYVRIRPFHKPGAAAAALTFLVYAPFSIPALSYNSMGSDLLVLAAVLLLTSQKHLPVQYILSGVCFAGSVLCCPYLAAVWAIYAVAALVSLIRKRKPAEGEMSESMRFVWFTAGCGILAVIVLIFVFSRTSWAVISAALPQIFNDPEHTNFSFWSKLKQYFRAYGMYDTVFTCIWWLQAVLAASVACDKTRRDHRALYVMLALMIAATDLILILVRKPYLNHLMMPLNLTALICRMCFPEEKFVKQTFRWVWIPGMLYTFCLHMGSNQQYYGIFSAGAAPLAGSMIIIAVCVTALLQQYRTRGIRWSFLVTAAAVALLQFGSELYLRWHDVFWDGAISAQTEKIENGPSKGLTVTPSSMTSYNSVCSTAAYMKLLAPDAQSILFLSDKTYSYLICEDMENSAYSAWLATIDSRCVNRLKAYYELRPEKTPDVILVDAAYTELTDSLTDIAFYRIEPLPNGADLLIRES